MEGGGGKTASSRAVQNYIVRHYFKKKYKNTNYFKRKHHEKLCQGLY
jgi:hypothetical protein